MAAGTPERRYRNYCLIDGVEREFTMASENPNPDMGNITDLRYLGVGTDSRHVRLQARRPQRKDSDERTK